MKTAKIFLHTLVGISTVFYTLAVALLGVPSIANAQVPTSIGYNGRLFNSAGSALTGTYYFWFDLESALTGGTTAASNIQATNFLATPTSAITVTNGFFSVQIPLGTDLSAFSDNLFFEIKVASVDLVGSAETLSPRIEMTKVPYSIYTQAVETVSSAPTDDLFDGRMYYNTTTDLVSVYRDGAWAALATSLDDAYNGDSGERTVAVDNGDVAFDLSGTSNFVIDTTTGTGDVLFQDAGATWVTFSDGQAITTTGSSAISLTSTDSNISLTASDADNDGDKNIVLSSGNAAPDAGENGNDVAIEAEDDILLESTGDVIVGSGADFNVDTLAGISLDADTASNFSTSAGALTLDGAGGINIVGNAAEVDVTTTGALDLNSAAATWDSSAGISLDAATASNFTTAAGDLTLSASASSVVIRSAEAATDSIYLDADGTAGGGIYLDAYDVATNTSGVVTMDGSYVQVNTYGAAGPGGAGFDVNVGGSGSLALSTTDGAISFSGGGASGGVNVTSALASITLDTQTGSQSISLGTSDVARTINLGTGTGADTFNFGAGADQFNFVSTETSNNPVDMTFNSLTTGNGLALTATSLTSGNAVDLTLASTTGSAINITDTAQDGAAALLDLNMTDATVTAQSYVIRGTYADNDDSNADFVLFEDAGGTQFAIAHDGSTTITGTEASNALTVTTGDVAVSNGSISVTDDDNAASLAVANNSATTVGFGASTGVVSLSSTSLTTGSLLNLELTEGTLIGGYYLRAWDATGGSEVFKVGEDGNTTIAGTALGTDALTLTAGDILLSSGNFDLTSGDFNVGVIDGQSANIDGDGSPTADILSVGSGDTSATDGVDALFITSNVSGASGAALHIDPSFTTGVADDYNVISIDAFGATTTANVASNVSGINIGNLTETENTADDITSSAINIGTGWDVGLLLGSGIMLTDGVPLVWGTDSDVSAAWDNTDVALEFIGGLVSFGEDPGTQGTADGSGDVYVLADLEVDGVVDLDGSVDADVTSFDVLSAGAISLDAAGLSSNFTLASDNNGDDLTIAVTGATDSSIVLVSSGTGTDAISIAAQSGGMDIASLNALTIDSVAGSVSIDAVGASSNFTLDANSAADDLTISVTGAFDSSLLLSSAGTGTDAIGLTASAGGITIDSSGALDLNSSAGTINIGNDAVAQAVNIATGAAARVITIGNAASASLALEAGVGAFTALADTTMDLDAGGALSLNSSAGAINIGNDAVAQKLTIGELTTRTEVELNALLIDINAGIAGITLDSTGTIALNGSDLNLGVADGNSINLDGDGSPTVTPVIVGTGDTSATDGVDGMQISFATSNATGDVLQLSPTFSDTNADLAGEDWKVLRISDFTVTQNDTSGAITSTMSGIHIGAVTEDLQLGNDSVVSTGISIAAGWDIGISSWLSDLTLGTPDLTNTGTQDTIIVAGNAYPASTANGNDIELTAEDSLILHSTGVIDVDSATTVSLNSSAGVINLGNDNVNQNINVGTAGVRTIAVGNASATAVNIDALALSLDAAGGSSNFTLAANSAADDLTISVTGAFDSSLLLSSAGTGTDAIGLIASAGGITIDASGAIDLNSTGGAINIGNDGDANAINIGTGLAARTITIGNNTATAIAISSGNNITVTPATGTNVFNVATGNLTVGGGTPDTVLDGVDAYITGTLEVDGATNFDGAADFSAGITNSAGEFLVSGGNMQFNDSMVLSFGTTDDVALSWNDAGGAFQMANGLIVVGGAAGGATATGASDLLVKDALEVDGATDLDGALDVDGATNLDQVSIDTTDGAFTVSGANTITLGNDAGTVSIDSSDWNITTDGTMSGIGAINTGVDLFSVSVTGAVLGASFDNSTAAGLNIGATNATSIAIGTAATTSTTLDAAAFSIDAAGGSSNISLEANSAADDLTIAVTGAYNSSLLLTSTGTGTDAIGLNASAGSITIDALTSIIVGNNLLTDVAGDNTIGSTSAEWDGVYLGSDGVGLTFGASQSAKLSFDTTDADANTMRLVLPESTATNVPILLIGDASMTGDLTQFAGETEPGIAIFSDDAGDYARFEVADNGNLTITSQNGGITLANNWNEIAPGTAGFYDLGTASAEWGGIFIGDNDNGLQFGADQDLSMKYVTAAAYTDADAEAFPGFKIDIDTDNNIFVVETDDGVGTYNMIFAPGNVDDIDNVDNRENNVFMISEIAGTVDDIFVVDETGAIFSDTAGATAADFAEYMLDTQKDLRPGELVSVDVNNAHGVTRSSGASDPHLMGIVSTKPGFIANAPQGRRHDSSYAAIAFMGQVPVLVNEENGPIAIGDYITSSSTPGVGMKANAGDPTVAVALTTVDSQGTIMGLVSRNNGSLQGGNQMGSVLSFGVDVVANDQEFSGSVTVAEHLYGSHDMAGRVRLASGKDKVVVTFEKPFAEGSTPIITFSSRSNSDSADGAWVSDESVTGFTINRSNSEAQVEYNWIAIGVYDAQVTVSLDWTDGVTISVTDQNSPSAPAPVEPSDEEEVVPEAEEVVEEEVVPEAEEVVEDVVVEEPGVEQSAQ